MDTLQSIYGRLREILGFSLFTLGESSITLGDLLIFLVLLIALFYFAGKLKKWLNIRLLVRTSLDPGARQAVASISGYVFILIGLLIIMQTIGLNLTTLNVFAGAVGLGIAFGLQNIASNFISGLIILFERPVKIGDRIEVGTVQGDVVEIGSRSTTVITNDNIAIIIPNSKLITENVVNWKHNNDKVRFRIPVGVAYGSDLKLVEKLLLEAAQENPDVLEEPPPVVRFLEFGDNGLLFELRPWSTTLIHRRGKLTSALNFAIYDKFKANDIQIPFPQRDIHIRSGHLDAAQV